MDGSQQVDVAGNIEPAYMTYAPGLGSTCTGKSYSTYFTQLGFSSPAVALAVRDELIRDVRAHVDTSNYKYLRKEDNRNAFKTMVSEFLNEYGTTYWGISRRDHLVCQDVRKGFLCPRDAQREGSRLVQVLESMFDYKADSAQKNDRHRPDGRQTVRHIDFSAMTGRAADTAAFVSPLQAFLEDANSSTITRPPASQRRKHQRLPSDSENEFDASEDLRIPDRDYPRSYLRPSVRRRHESFQRYSLRPSTARLTNPRPQSPTTDFSIEPVYPPSRTKKQKRSGHSFGGQSRESTSDSDQTIVRSKYRTNDFTASTTQTPLAAPSQFSSSALPTRPKTAQIIDLTPSQPSAEHLVKEELIPTYALSKTILLVSASNQPSRAEIAVEFSSCRDIEQLFSALIEARDLRPETAKKVNVISATYSWDKKRLGLRKGKVEDWVRFCRAIRKAWESESVHFEDECEVEMMIHVDE